MKKFMTNHHSYHNKMGNHKILIFLKVRRTMGAKKSKGTTFQRRASLSKLSKDGNQLHPTRKLPKQNTHSHVIRSATSRGIFWG
jgi:hypothetical protein